jgi:hypothetical protein
VPKTGSTFSYRLDRNKLRKARRREGRLGASRTTRFCSQPEKFTLLLPSFKPFGGRLVELHRDWAVIDLPVNRSQRIFYRRNVDPAKITLPWLKQASFR